jgi:hypothetical protein
MTENSILFWRYLITVSARASTFGGSVTPICLAVFVCKFAFTAALLETVPPGPNFDAVSTQPARITKQV